jgi:hypothetical protein
MDKNYKTCFILQNTFKTPVYVTSQRRNAMGVGLVFEADLANTCYFDGGHIFYYNKYVTIINSELVHLNMSDRRNPQLKNI